MRPFAVGGEAKEKAKGQTLETFGLNAGGIDNVSIKRHCRAKLMIPMVGGGVAPR